MATQDGLQDVPAGQGSRVYRWLDARFDLQDGLLGKAFPEARYASFLLGEVAMACLVILGLTGIFLGFVYHPATQLVTYHGALTAYNGQAVPAAFASVLSLTYDVRVGMFVRMLHHWAAYLFVAAIALHLMRVFFTGAYRNPRELNWVVGVMMLLLGLVEGFTGYALPYDNFSKTATGIGFQMTQSVPVVGPWLQNLIFGGSFPEEAARVLPRLFFLHVWLLPAVLVPLLGLHLLMVVRQKHTEDPGGDRTETTVDPTKEDVVVGIPMVPNQAILMGVVFLATAGILALLAGFLPVQDIVATGPANPTTTPAGVGPDWYFMWVYGYLKLVPSLPGDLSRVLGGVVLPGITILVLLLWPFLDRSKAPVHFTANPLDRPVQTAVGVAAIVLVILLSLVGMNDTVSNLLGTTNEALYPYLAAVTILVPVLVGLGVHRLLARRRSRGHTTRGRRPTPHSQGEDATRH